MLNDDVYACNGASPEDIRKLPSYIKHLEIHDAPVHTISKAAFSRFATSLEYLKCRNCSISNIEHGVFGDFKQLHSLDLHDNDLEKIETGMFEANSELHTLVLSNNAIQTFESGVFKELPNLKLLQVSGNYQIPSMYQPCR